MILLMILTIIALLVAFSLLGFLLSLGVAGGVFLLMFADLIACAAIIYCIIKCWRKRKNGRK